MMKSYKYWYLFAILLVILAIFYIFSRGTYKTKTVTSVGEIDHMRNIEKTKAEVNKEKKKTPSLIRQIELLNMTWVRDPFCLDPLKEKTKLADKPKNQELFTVDERLMDIELTGIVFFDNEYMALINDQGVREDDTILGFKVLKIKRDYIVLADSKGKYFTLELK